MRHLEKVIIFSIMVMVLIYTVNVDRTPLPSKNRIAPISNGPAPRPVAKNKASFFPESNPSPEDESIIEETFTEVP
jgi:hypothetical protein